MYWRVRKHTPKEMLRLYGVHVALAISIFCNLFQLATRPNLNKFVAPEAKVALDAFARKVTEHILDTSYITYEDSTTSLINNELSPPVQQILQQQQALPRNIAELKATAKTYAAQRRVSAVRINQVDVLEKDTDKYGRIPVEVSGVVAVHSAEESDPGPVSFKFRFTLGYSTKDPKALLVANFQDLSPPAR